MDILVHPGGTEKFSDKLSRRITFVKSDILINFYVSKNFTSHIVLFGQPHSFSSIDISGHNNIKLLSDTEDLSSYSKLRLVMAGKFLAPNFVPTVSVASVVSVRLRVQVQGTGQRR